MKRIIADLSVLAALVVCVVVVHALERSSISVSRFSGRHFWLIWIAVMILAALVRATLGQVMSSRESSLRLGLIEWFGVAVVANLLLVLSDVLWHPEYSFETVFVFGLFPVIVPSVLASTIIYFLIGRVGSRFLKQQKGSNLKGV